MWTAIRSNPSLYRCATFRNRPVNRFFPAAAALILTAIALFSTDSVLFASTLYENKGYGFRLDIPAQLKVNFTRQNPAGWAADNRMPVDYVNFGPAEGSADLDPFELGVGVHWNRDRLDTRTFADKKDEGLISGGAQIKVIRQSQVSVCGISGVRDDFLLLQPYGWRSYSRIIIPYKDNFLVFLGTLGEGRPRPQLERLYQNIVDSLQLP